MDTVRCEEYQASLTWIPVSRAMPEPGVWVWVQTDTGRVTLGFWGGISWSWNEQRLGASVIRWAEIEYPEGPVYIP